MTTLGWIFLATSLSFVWGLTGWCFYKVLTLPPVPPAAKPGKDGPSA